MSAIDDLSSGPFYHGTKADFERGRIYIVEPTGPISDDPNLTDRKYPGNPTKSYRTRDPIRVTGEVTDWTGHTPEQLKVMMGHLAELKRLGIEAIED